MLKTLIFSFSLISTIFYHSNAYAQFDPSKMLQEIGKQMQKTIDEPNQKSSLATPTAAASKQSQQTPPPPQSSDTPVGLDEEYVKKYGGIYAASCSSTATNSIHISKHQFTVILASGGKLTASNIEGSVSADMTNKNFEIAIVGEASPNIGATFSIYKDKGGFYGMLNGHPQFEKNIGGSAATKKVYRYCGKSPQSNEVAGANAATGTNTITVSTLKKSLEFSGSYCFYWREENDNPKKDPPRVAEIAQEENKLRIGLNGVDRILSLQLDNGIWSTNFDGYTLVFTDGAPIKRKCEECSYRKTKLQFKQGTLVKQEVKLIGLCGS